jgi:CTP:molybdopterin cytidylyltransferase MocA
VNAIVMAAGEGRRMRPISERWPKPLLPIDGRPVVATLLRELRNAGCEHITVVTGHLAKQVEALLGDGSGFGVRLSYVRQPQQNGSADAVRCALEGGAAAPVLVAGADHVFAAGTLARFAAEWNGAAGALAARRGRPPVDARVARVFVDPDELASVPLWGIGAEVVPFLADLPGPPYELAEGFHRALEAGLEVRGVVVPGTRDLTHPVDLIRENFPYLSNP